ncbi:MAG: hypothetical protein WCD18_24235 [Thermosynechococcaceae cyanobacterium]
MANISITDLTPAGTGLFTNSESLIYAMHDLSENELRMTVGGGGSCSYKTKSSKSSKSSKSCSCGGGGGGGGEE